MCNLIIRNVNMFYLANQPKLAIFNKPNHIFEVLIITGKGISASGIWQVKNRCKAFVCVGCIKSLR